MRWRQAEWPGEQLKFLEPDARGFFDSLPDLVTIYRGCNRSRVRGISWTTDRAVAEAFWRGHRNIRWPDPVLAEAFVPKEAVFAPFVGRQESELVIDPRRLRRLTVIDWVPSEAAGAN